MELRDLLEQSDIGHMTAVIHNNHMEAWGVTVEALYQLSKENLKRLLPVTIKSLTQVTRELLLGESKMCGNAEWPEEGMVEDENPMYVLSNSSGMAGACCMLPGMGLERLADRLGKNLIVLLSSVHEIIAMPYDVGMDLDSMMEMVREINKELVAEEDFLSDEVYYYSRKRGNEVGKLIVASAEIREERM